MHVLAGVRCLRGRRQAEFDAAVAEAVAMGPLGEELLADAVDTARGWQRVVNTAALGHAAGRPGPQILRRLVCQSGPGTQDLRCAALYALATRSGEQASDALLAALGDRNGAVRSYAPVSTGRTAPMPIPRTRPARSRTWRATEPPDPRAGCAARPTRSG
jgi:hypothetical protein